MCNTIILNKDSCLSAQEPVEGRKRSVCVCVCVCVHELPNPVAQCGRFLCASVVLDRVCAVVACGCVRLCTCECVVG